MLKREQKYTKQIRWGKAPDIKLRIKQIGRSVRLEWPGGGEIHCLRSKNANTGACARIWGLSRIWQETLNLSPAYIIEVISEKFDNLPKKQQDAVLLHELAHIPNNFSGSLIPHIRRGKRKFSGKVARLIRDYETNNITR